MDKIEVGKHYYVPDKNALNTCFRVKVLEIIDNRAAKVIASPRHPNSKKGQKPKRPFIIPMFLLHEKQEDAFIKSRDKLGRKACKKKNNKKAKENNNHENHE